MLKEVESQAISYTAGVPPIAAAILVAKGVWNPKTMANVEELNPYPFIEVLNRIGLPTKVKDIKLKNGKPTKDGMPVSATKSNDVKPSEVW